jgi:hypothetical protein
VWETLSDSPFVPFHFVSWMKKQLSLAKWRVFICPQMYFLFVCSGTGSIFYFICAVTATIRHLWRLLFSGITPNAIWCFLHIQIRTIHRSYFALMIAAVYSYEATWHHTPKYSNLNSHRRKILKPECFYNRSRISSTGCILTLDLWTVSRKKWGAVLQESGQIKVAL